MMKKPRTSSSTGIIKTKNKDSVTDTIQVAVILNDLIQENRVFTPKIIGEKGLERWGNKKIINEILDSNPNLKSINTDWMWVKHNYIKLISLVLNIKKSCDLSGHSLTKGEIENAIKCIKNDPKLDIIKINLDELSAKDKKDFFGEILKISQKIEEFSLQHYPSMEEICRKAYIETDDKENFRCNIADGQYQKIYVGRNILSIDEDFNTDIEPNINNSSLSHTALGLLLFPLPVTLTFFICAGYRYYQSYNEQIQDFDEGLLGTAKAHEYNE